jgi:uncharacterized damage-inducible protein DinB
MHSIVADGFLKENLPMTTGLSDFYKYNLWANLRLLDACARLTNEQLDATMVGTFGSIRETLMHMLSSEEGYAGHFTGTYPQPRLHELPAFPGFDELRRRAEQSGKSLITISEQHDLSEVRHLDNGTYDALGINVMIQVINHGIDHRSQIATLLAQQGIEAPGLDGWDYNDATYLAR